MLNVKNVYNGSELRFALLEVIEEKQPMEIVFHEDEFGFEEEQTEIYITFTEGRYNVTVNGQTKKFVSEWTFKDYVFAVCGW